MSNPERPRWADVQRPALVEWRQAHRRRKVPISNNKGRPVPTLPYEYWCSPAGNLVRRVVMTTRNVAEAHEPRRYMEYDHHRAVREGWFPWEYGDARAYCAALVKDMTAEQWEKERERILQERRAEHLKESEQYRAAWKTKDEAEMLRMNQALTGALREVIDTVKKGGAGDKGGGK